jgi:hypothetical protein
MSEVARFQLRATGGISDSGQMPITELIGVLQSAANITRRSTLLVLGRPSPSPEDLRNVQIRILPPSSGSFIVTVSIWVLQGVVVSTSGELLKGAAGTTIQSIGSGIRKALFGKPDEARELALGEKVGEAIRRIYNDLLGHDVAPVGSRMEPKLPWFDNLEEVSEDLEPSFKKMADSIPTVDSDEEPAAKQIAMIGPSANLAPPQNLFVLDADAKAELEFEIISEKSHSVSGRVRQLNERSGKGVFVLDARASQLTVPGLMARNSVRFWPGNQGRSEVERLADNLAFNAGQATNNARPISMTVRTVSTRSGRVKRVLVDSIRG